MATFVNVDIKDVYRNKTSTKFYSINMAGGSGSKDGADRLGFFRYADILSELALVGKRGRKEDIIDLGAGPGWIGIYAGRKMRNGGNLYFVDMSPEMISLAQENVANERAGGRLSEDVKCTFVCVTGENMLDFFKDKQVDAVLSRFVIDLLDNPTGIFASSFNVLKEGGRFVFNLAGHNTYNFSDDGSNSLFESEFYSRLARATINALPLIISQLPSRPLAELIEKNILRFDGNNALKLNKKVLYPRFDKESILRYLFNAGIPLSSVSSLLFPQIKTIGFRLNFSEHLMSIPLPGIWDVLPHIEPEKRLEIIHRVYDSAFKNYPHETYQSIDPLFVVSK